MSDRNQGSRSFLARPERFRPKHANAVRVRARGDRNVPIDGRVVDISTTGVKVLVADESLPREGDGFKTLRFEVDGARRGSGAACVVRSEPLPVDDSPSGLGVVVFRFAQAETALIAALRRHLVYAPYVTDELCDEETRRLPASVDAAGPSILDYYRVDSPDLFAKCNAFYEVVRDLQHKKFYQALYRVTLTSGLDHRITVFNPFRRTEEPMICFDSNSYLGLHLHPRVCEAVKRAIDQVGYGTPSAQLLSGTNRYLRELEETLAAFHGREDAVVFPSGYAANVGALTALVREKDLVVRDRFSHASIHDGARATTSRLRRAYPHDDLAALEEILKEADASGNCMGKLIVTDGVFSMHGRMARLPELSALARRYNAKLMVDEAHATGVIGATGRGLEEHFEVPGAIDVLMGTFSKAPGSMGGYVVGARDLVYYLRFYATTAMFTASLPAATCAGVTEAFRVMQEEPEHRERLWRNVRAFVPALCDAGLIVPTEMQSAIVTVFLGSSKLLWLVSRDLFDAGIKCGSVAFPAVPLGEAIARLAVNARHNADDLARTVEVFTRIGRKYGILGKTAPEVFEIGERLSLDAPLAEQAAERP
ncbi:MAG: aminotransferase class I/II-fold pyridoxal phosphate-dependent enzyme [Deltaproteobacteria bacterium]|nr:aminotransferase class I/II-fold pyridoxal phosphate-dependent enzyme [Deltaproteobacteria bacterium]